MAPWERYGQQAQGPWARYAQPDRPENTVADVAKAGGVGIAEGGIGLAGMVGDFRDLASRATDLAGEKLGFSPESVAGFKEVAGRAARTNPLTALVANAPTSAQIQEKVEGQTGEFYQPQTTAGEYARTVGQFLPAAVAGPGGILRRVGMQAVLPALASEAAGQYTKGTAAEPYARTGAALATGILTAGRARPQRVTAEDLRGAARHGYRDPAVTGLVIKPSAAARLGQNVERAMETGGARRSFAGPAFSVTDELLTLPNTSTGQAMRAAGLNPGATVDDIKSVRTALGKVVEGGTDPLTGKLNPTAGAGVTARKKINEYLANLPASDVRSGDPVKAGRILRAADADYAASQRARTVESLMRRAELQAGSSHSGQNVNNATRQKLRTLLTNEKKTGGFTKAEMDQLERAVMGTKTGNVARFLGNALAPSGAMLFQNSAAAAGLGGLAAYGAGNDPTTAALAAAVLSQGIGRGARRIGNASTARQVRKFQDMVVKRAPSYQSIASGNTAAAKQLTAEQRRLALARALASSQVAPRLNAYQD